MRIMEDFLTVYECHIVQQKKQGSDIKRYLGMKENNLEHKI